MARIRAGDPLDLDGVDAALLDSVGIDGRTPLMLAVAVGRLDLVQELVLRGASVGATGMQGLTALHEAAVEGAEEVAMYLLARGASADAPTVLGDTPLMSAAAFGNTGVVRILLEHGADASKRNDDGFTAADWARMKGEDEAASVIEAYGATRG